MITIVIGCAVHKLSVVWKFIEAICYKVEDAIMLAMAQQRRRSSIRGDIGMFH